MAEKSDSEVGVPETDNSAGRERDDSDDSVVNDTAAEADAAEPDAFDRIIARIKRDLSQNTSRLGGGRGLDRTVTSPPTPPPPRDQKTTSVPPSSPSSMDPVFYVTGSRVSPSSLNVCQASRVASPTAGASTSDGKRRGAGFRTRIRSATVRLGSWRNFPSGDRTFWECKTPFVFTGARQRVHIKRIEEEGEDDVTTGREEEQEKRGVTKGEFEFDVIFS